MINQISVASSDRLVREQEFHDVAFSGDLRECTEKYYALTEIEWRRYECEILKLSQSSTILEYGCGPYGLIDRAAVGAESAHAIDISPVAIEITKEKAKAAGVDVDARVMNCEELEFEDNSFDLIFGCSILHHLDLDRSFEEMNRVLKPGGTLIFIEPLGLNPCINLYRALTPHLRTEDEHPFRSAELNKFADSFSESQLDFFHLTTFAAVPFGKLSGFKSIRNFFHRLDQTTFRFLPFMRRFAWMSLLRAKK